MRQKASKSGSAGEKTNKSDMTRARILSAARRVFARLPYHAASMRMIGKEGKFNHELIRYHFPSKAKLFETIMKDMSDDFYFSNISFLEGIAELSVEEGFSTYIDRFLAHYYRNPEALRIIVINMVITPDFETIPGYRYIPEMLASTRRTFREKIPVRATDSDVERFLSGFNSMLLHFLGADYCQARILGMKHTERRYREWVRMTLLELFLPHLKRLIGR